MRISPIASFNPRFTSYSREVKNPNPDMNSSQIVRRDILWRNNTHFFREDISWGNFAKFLNEKYKNTTKVNTYCYACSDGSEPYTFIIQMQQECGRGLAQMFFPVIAKDIDPYIIDKAKSGNINLTDTDVQIINNKTFKRMNDYFVLSDGLKDEGNNFSGKIYKALPLLTDNVEFEQANILDDFVNIKPDNTIVMCRNFWPYLEWGEREYLAKKLYNQLGKNSCVVLGNFDMGQTYRLLSDAGFKTNQDFNFLVFQK